MNKSISVSCKCCATCIYWDGKVKFSIGLFGEKVTFDDSQTAKCNKISGLFLTRTCKGTDGGGIVFPCNGWKQRY